YVQRFWRILVQTDTVLQRHRSPFLGKSSPVHFFWGSFDLALTVFSGRGAPERQGADRITQEAYSHEEISCGFWPGDERFPTPAFYSYTYPEPPGLGPPRFSLLRRFIARNWGNSFCAMKTCGALPRLSRRCWSFSRVRTKREPRWG